MNAKFVIPVIAVGYSIVRYGVAKGIPFENWPAFIGNKAMAIAAVLFLVLAVFNRIKNPEQMKNYFQLSFYIGLTHGISSIGLFNEAYYGYLHIKEVGRLNVFGELTIVFGAIALSYFFYEMQRVRNKRSSGELVLLSVLIVHVLSVGILKWVDLSRWAYGLVPISLIGFLTLCVGVFIFFRQKKYVAS